MKKANGEDGFMSFEHVIGFVNTDNLVNIRYFGGWAVQLATKGILVVAQ